MPWEIQIDLWRCFHILWKKRLLIILVAVAAFLFSYLSTRGITGDTYSAVSTVYSTADGGFSLEQAQQTTSAMQRYAEVAKSLKVLNRASELMGEQVTGQTLSRMITVSYTKDSSILKVQAISSSPILAISAANAVAVAFVSEITTITGQNTAQVLDVAVNYSVMQNGAQTRWNMRILSVALSVIVTCAVILLTDILSPKVHSATSASLNGELEMLGIIPDIDMLKRGDALDSGEKITPKVHSAAGASLNGELETLGMIPDINILKRGDALDRGKGIVPMG